MSMRTSLAAVLAFTLLACGEPAKSPEGEDVSSAVDTPSAASPDGHLDCTGSQWETLRVQEEDSDAKGQPDPETALEDALAPYMTPRVEVVRHDDAHASLVDGEGRELVVASVSESNGTWFVDRLEGCDVDS